MPSVTVVGADNTVLTVSLDGTTNFQLAQQFAALVNSAASAGTLSASILSDTAAAAPVPAGYFGEAQVTQSGASLAFPAGYSALLDLATGTTTISGATATGPISVLAGGGGTTFNAGPQRTIFIAGGGSNVFNGYVAPGGVTTLPGAGSSTLDMVATGAGNDTITTGTGNFDVDAGAGSNTIVLGNGINYVNSLGQDLITGGPAHLTAGVADASTIYLSGTGATVKGSSGLLDISDTNGITSPGGGGDVVTLGSGGGIITGVRNSTFTLAGIASVAAGGNDTINVGGATAIVRADTTAAGAGPTFVTGPTGAGTLMFIGGTAGSTVAGGTVALTIGGASGGSVTFTGAASGNLLMVSSSAGTGAALIDASAATGNNTFVTGQQASTVLGGSGADLFMISTAASSLTGGAGAANIYEFQASATGGASDVITDFKATDKLAISGYSANGSAVLAGASVTGGTTTITLSDQTRIVLQNFATLTGGNFS